MSVLGGSSCCEFGAALDAELGVGVRHEGLDGGSAHEQSVPLLYDSVSDIWRGIDMGIRRVVTGHDSSGQAVFVSDEPVGGFRVGLFTVAPDSVTLPEDLDIGAALAEMEARLPGLAAHMEPDHPGMHTTATVDFEFVMIVGASHDHVAT